jgi:hypothetical protein
MQQQDAYSVGVICPHHPSFAILIYMNVEFIAIVQESAGWWNSWMEKFSPIPSDE